MNDIENIRCVIGDITEVQADAIVNAANPKMLGGGGVDGAIHLAAGPSLLEACRKVKPVDGIRCPFGQSRITSAGNLKARFVIHSVGPIYRKEEHPEQLLQAAYKSACALAIANDCRSIAFPALSCGAYGYPHKEAALIAIKTCSREEFRNLQITFYLFSRPIYAIFADILASPPWKNNSEK